MLAVEYYADGGPANGVTVLATYQRASAELSRDRAFVEALCRYANAGGDPAVAKDFVEQFAALPRTVPNAVLVGVIEDVAAESVWALPTGYLRIVPWQFSEILTTSEMLALTQKWKAESYGIDSEIEGEIEETFLAAGDGPGGESGGAGSEDPQ